MKYTNRTLLFARFLYKNQKTKIQEKIVSLDLLHYCEKWFIYVEKWTQPKGIFVNRILRRIIFGFMRDENQRWRNLQNAKLHSLYRSTTIACLTTDHEVAGSIPGTPTNFECGLGLERGPPSLVRTIRQLLDGEVADLIKKVDIIRLDGA